MVPSSPSLSKEQKTNIKHMEIVYSLNDSLFHAETPEELKKEITEYISAHGVKPTVEILEGGLVRVSIDSKLIDEMKQLFNRAMTHCNSRQFDKALPILREITQRCPTFSEAWRVLAQIHWLEDGDIDKAQDELIESLRCEPRNVWALILMGNLLSKGKNDPESAEGYYRRVLEYHPDNAIAINNVAAVYMEKKEYEKAMPLFEQALSHDKTYTNSYYGLGICHYKLGNLEKAFEVCHEGALQSVEKPENPDVRQELLKLYLTVAGELAKKTNYMNVWLGIRDELEAVDGRKIKFLQDKSLQVCAKMEYSIAHGTDHHVVRFNPEKPYVDHLFIHELMHLRMAQKATKAGRGRAVVESTETRKNFNERFGRIIRKMHPKVSGQEIEAFITDLRHGMCSQLQSGPLDLFVEQLMYDTYPVVRPVQLLSLFHMEQENIKSVQTGEKSGVFPTDIVKANKLMNICTSLHFRDMYGISLVGEYHPTKAEMAQATDLYEEFKAYRKTFKDGDEFEMVEYFTESLQMDDILCIKDEKEMARAVFDRQEEPFMPEEGVGPTEDEIKESNEDFASNHPDGGDATETMMMSMYMVGAMEYLDKLDVRSVQTIAMQIARVGQTGISPKGTYSIPAIPDKEFGGYQFLAYYYVSWARAYPEALDRLGLPFKTAYETAKQMYNKRKDK